MFFYRFFITRHITVELTRIIFNLFNFIWTKNKIKICGYPIIKFNKNLKIILGRNIVFSTNIYKIEKGCYY